MRCITDNEFAPNSRRVLVRADFNVPLDEQGRIADDSRIRATLPTIRFLLEREASVVLMSHMGRPEGPDPALSLTPVAARLSELLGEPVIHLPDCIGEDVESAVASMYPGEVVLLENLRYHPGEEANDPEFARQLASLGDLYVNDAFGAAHRAHASVVGVAGILPSYAGLLLEREVRVLSGAMQDPARPLIVVLGGAKVTDKIGVVDHLLPMADSVLLGGGMCFTFLKGDGREIGRSLLDQKHFEAARGTLRRARAEGRQLVLPTDVILSQEVKQAVNVRSAPVDAIPSDAIGVDIGPETSQAYARIVREARTVIWNGPMGVFEVPEFAGGTKAVGEAVQGMTAAGGFSIIGGGDTVAAIEELGCADGISHLSTGGGASLEFLEGKTLPGVAALS